MKAPFLLGRLIFGGFFLYNGINHFKERRNMVKYVDQKNVLAPELAVTGTGLALIVGGSSILLGLKPKIGFSRRVPRRSVAGYARFLAGRRSWTANE